MYSVTQGLNSAWTTLPVLSVSADLALWRSVVWVCIWRSTSRLILARRADLWIWWGRRRERGGGHEKENCAQSHHSWSHVDPQKQIRNQEHLLRVSDIQGTWHGGWCMTSDTNKDHLVGRSGRAYVVRLPACHVCVLLPWTVESKRMPAVLGVVRGLPRRCRPDPPEAPRVLWGFGGFGLLWSDSTAVCSYS